MGCPPMAANRAMCWMYCVLPAEVDAPIAKMRPGASPPIVDYGYGVESAVLTLMPVAGFN